MEILVAIVGVLVGVIGILGGVVKSKNTQNDILKDEVNKAQKVNSVNEEITDVVTKTETQKNSVAKKNGILFAFLLFILFDLYGCSPVAYTPVAPNLVTINYRLEPVAYEYNDTIDLFTLTQINMDNLVYNINTLKEVISKYENQITLYNRWRKE